jgi:AraC-like DNA-binding protein/quercetin dioxygenase-like cupin family protein
MAILKIKDGFLGEKQINVPRDVVINRLRKKPFAANLFVTQIGYFPKARFHYRERQYGCHDNILIYCLEGKGHYQTSNGNYTLQANQFMILPSGKFHIYQADTFHPWTIYWIHFSGQLLRELNTWMQIDNYIAPTAIEYDKKIIDQWAEIYNALEGGYSDNNLAFANLNLYRFLSYFLCERPEKIASLPEQDPIAESITYMKSNISKTLSVEDLAKKIKYSNSHYTSLFKSKTGLSPIDYFIRLKIQYACQLLSQTDLKINIIAGKIGYDDSFYFSRLFKKVHGKSPRGYRLALKKTSPNGN